MNTEWTHRLLGFCIPISLSQYSFQPHRICMQQYKKLYKLLKYLVVVQERNIIIHQNIIIEVEVFTVLFTTQWHLAWCKVLTCKQIYAIVEMWKNSIQKSIRCFFYSWNYRNNTCLHFLSFLNLNITQSLVCFFSCYISGSGKEHKN